MPLFRFSHTSFSRIFHFLFSLPPSPLRTAMRNAKVIALFDIDGTLTPSRAVSLPDSAITLLSPEHPPERQGHAGPPPHEGLRRRRRRIRPRQAAGTAGRQRYAERAAPHPLVTRELDYSFSQNGLVAYRNGELIHSKVRRIPSRLVLETQRRVLPREDERVPELRPPLRRRPRHPRQEVCCALRSHL